VGAARRARWSTRVLAALAVSGFVAGAITGYGCSVYDSSLLLPGPAADSGASGRDAPPIVDAGPDVRDAIVADAPPPACPGVYPPSAPATNPPGNQSFVAAVHTIEILDDAGGAPQNLGFDLDKVYSCCDAGPGSCSPGVAGAMHYCDDPGGRDNNASALLALLASLAPTQFNTSTIAQRLQTGAYSILIQVLDYNGQANDNPVTAAIYAAPGVETDSGVAAWDGTDHWYIDQNFVVQADASPLIPTHIDGNAYVANGTLVMHLDFPIYLGSSTSGSFSISLTAGVVTGDIVPAGNGTYRLANGQLAGRWNVSDLLATVQTLNYMGTPLCEGSQYYELLVKPNICQYVDIMTDPMKDFTGVTCDALSLGFGFTADPALIGDVVPPTTSPALCGDAAPDDCTH